MPGLEDTKFNTNNIEDRKMLVYFLQYYMHTLSKQYPTLPHATNNEFNKICTLLKSDKMLVSNPEQLIKLLSRVNHMSKLPYRFAFNPQTGSVRHLDTRTASSSKFIKQFQENLSSKKQKQVRITDYPLQLGPNSIDIYHLDITKMTLAQKRNTMEVILKNLMGHGMSIVPYDLTTIELYSEEVINDYLTRIRAELMCPNSDISRLLYFTTKNEAGRQHFVQDPSKRQKTPTSIIDPRYIQAKPIGYGRQIFIQTTPQIDPMHRQSLNISASSRAFADRLATLSPYDPEFSLLGLHAKKIIIELHERDQGKLPEQDIKVQQNNIINAVKLDQSEGWDISRLLAFLNQPKHLYKLQHGRMYTSQKPKPIIKDPNRSDKKP